jgi:hypothetical protein
LNVFASIYGSDIIVREVERIVLLELNLSLAGHYLS